MLRRRAPPLLSHRFNAMARRRLLLLALALCGVSALYLVWGLRSPYGFILSLRGTRLAALLLVGASVGAATVLFQTITANRLLTPGIVGIDALFVLIQSVLVLLIGSVGYAALPALPKFLAEAGMLAAASMMLFRLALLRGAADITRMVLTGVVFGFLFRGLSSFVQRILNPSEFSIVQAASFASFTAIDPVQLAIAVPICLAALAFALRLAPALDVAGLGRDRARTLGLDHDRLVLTALGLVAALIAVATAVAGPFIFLGLLAASLAAALLDTHRHHLLLPGAAILGALVLVAGQLLFERALGLQSTLSVIVEFAGGLVFLFLVLKRRPT